MKDESDGSSRTFVAMQSRGVIALPAAVRKRTGLDEPGAQVEVVERDDGVIELRPHVPVPADQRWFWTDRWQAMEREVDEEIAAGKIRTFDSGDEFVEYLDSLEKDD